MPVPGAGPAPTTPIGFLKEHPKSKARVRKVQASIAEGSPVAELGPLLLSHDKDLVRAAAQIAAEVGDSEPVLLDLCRVLGHRDAQARAIALQAIDNSKTSLVVVEAEALPLIEDKNKEVAVAAIEHLAGLDEKERGAAAAALPGTDIAGHITELMDVARPRELKEALNGDDTLRARVAVAEVIRRADKGEALLYEARSKKDAAVSGAALAALRAMFLTGDLKPRARIDSLWLKKARLRS